MNIVELNRLNFFFGKEQVLNELNLKIPKGSIYGFLGPNGAGKSTTIRILTNLYKASSDQVKLFGKTYEEDQTYILKRIGSLIETPSLYSHLTGIQNLCITAKLLGVDEKRITKVLDIVKLSHASGKKVGEYSLGMKQRLGIAQALLGDAELLILDEPINGLDPKGIIEIRDLLLELNKTHHKTIFISSHILSEIDKLVTNVAVINHGQVLFDGTIEELRVKGKQHLYLDTSDNRKAIELTKEYNPVETEDNILQLDNCTREDRAKLNELLVKSDIDVYSLYSQTKNLEEIFLEMTEKR